jgi:hypothetical protein
MKNCHFYKAIQKQFCYIHLFMCHTVVFLAATSRVNSHPPHTGAISTEATLACGGVVPVHN